MSEQLREALSAAMDGEADAFELRRVLDEASADADLRDEWHRLHLLRDVLRDETHDATLDLGERIRAEMASIDEEALADEVLEPEPDLVAAPASPARSTWRWRLTGTAVAAAVATVVIMSGNLFTPAETPDLAATPTDVLNQAELTVPVMYQQATAQDRLRMDARRMEHYQRNALNNRGGVSFVRVVTFKQMKEPEQTERASDGLPPAGSR